MKYLFLFLLFFALLPCEVLSQGEIETKESNSYLPLDCLDKKIYVEKYEPITSFEIAQAINARENGSDNDSINGKSQIIEGANFFNLILYRKINNQITELTISQKDSLLEAVHKRDRVENINGNYRYLVLSDFSFTAFDEKSKVNPGYYLYDQETNTKYQTFPTVESLLSSITEARRRNFRGDQGVLDGFLARRNERDYQKLYSSYKQTNWSNIIYVAIIGTIITLASIF